MGSVLDVALGCFVFLSSLWLIFGERGSVSAWASEHKPVSFIVWAIFNGIVLWFLFGTEFMVLIGY